MQETKAYLVRVVHGKCHSACALKLKHCPTDWLSPIFWGEGYLQLTIAWHDKVRRFVLKPSHTVQLSHDQQLHLSTPLWFGHIEMVDPSRTGH